MATRVPASALSGLDSEADPEFQVAPMVDVLLVLLLFFMAVATAEVVGNKAELALPTARDGQIFPDHGGQLVVNLEAGGESIKIQGKSFQRAQDLAPLIQEAVLASRSAPEFRLLIRADQGTPFSRIAEVMKAGAAAGVSNVAFAVAGQEGGAVMVPQL